MSTLPAGTNPDGAQFQYDPVTGKLYKFNTTLKEYLESPTLSQLNLNAKQFGAKGDGSTDDTVILQEYLDSDNQIFYFPEGTYIVSGLDINSNSTLFFEDGAILKLKDASNRPVLQNKNYSLNIDENISITGLKIDGNFANQVHHLTSGPYANEPVSGLRFFGVKNLNIEKTYIYHSRTYGIWLSRIDRFVGRDIEFEQDTLTFSNQDGLHVNGVCSNMFIENISGLTNDDLLALNADDVPQGVNVSYGAITNVNISGVNFKNSLNGIRLLSATSLLDQIIIRNLVGIVRDNVVAISAYQLGVGNFGTIDINSVDVRTSNPHNVMGEYGGYILINDKSDHIKISNVNRVTGDDARPTVRIQGRADIQTLEIDGITTKINQSLTTYYPDISFETGSVVKNAFIENHKLLNGVYPNGFGIGLTGSTVEKLHLKTLYYEQIGYGVYFNNTDVTTFFSDGTNTNYIRYPFYLENDSHISFALITDQNWEYTFGTPKYYYIMDTSSLYIVDTGKDTFNDIAKRGNILNKTINGSASSNAYESILRYGIDGTSTSSIKGWNSFDDNLGAGLAFYTNPNGATNSEILALKLNNDGKAMFPLLSGTGERLVAADDNGLLKVSSFDPQAKTIQDTSLTDNQTSATLNAAYPSASVGQTITARNVGTGMKYEKINTTSGGTWVAWPISII